KVGAAVAGAEGIPAATNGLLVARILASGHALRDGLRLQDVIVAVEGVEVGDNRELAAALSRHGPGERVEITVLRDGEELSLRIALSERPPQA
ncbi:MAG: PDZ domain-containing protein, partial [Miltoncostaeaceae bacterium]